MRASIGIVFMALLLASCNSGGVPASSIYIVDRDSGRIISTSESRGSVTLPLGELLLLKVERLTSDDGGTQTSDVTTVASYSFIPDGIATANQLGELRALSVGTTRLEVRFRPDPLDSADRVFLDITVPAPPAE